MTPELIIAINAVVTGILIAAGTLIEKIASAHNASSDNKRAERKDEVALLREEISRLQNRQSELETKESNSERLREELRIEIERLRLENTWLRAVLLKNGIEIPEMPDSWK